MYRITFVLDPLRRGDHGATRREDAARGESYRVSSPTSSAPSLDRVLGTKSLQTLLAAMMLLDMDYLRAHPEIALAQDSQVLLEKQPFGYENWKDIPTILKTKVAETRDINCWQSAEARVRYGEAALPKLTSWPTSHRITYVLDLFRGAQEQHLSHRALCTLLTALTNIDIEYLKANPNTPLLYSSGVKYEEEPIGQEDWQDIPTTLALGIGDCEDLACWRAAELKVRYGIDARATFTYKIRANGSYLYHITVKLPDGRIEDPSRRLGMR